MSEAHQNAVANRLSLRAPQRESLRILRELFDATTFAKDSDPADTLKAVQALFPQVEDFERAFPSLCFALATGVGKTRLMGAFVAYLHRAHGIKHFFVLAPNLTIYRKLFDDFTPNTPKYVFKGIAEFALEAPLLITGDNYESVASGLFGNEDQVKINIFNISKINSEVRGGKSPRIKRMSEYLGEAYFDYLASLDDLVLLMDESHRYRASAGVRAINDLRPILGLELTATPRIEVGSKTLDFKNIVYDYRLARAMEDGFVKEPAVVTRKDFRPAGMTAGEIELMKLEDGVRLHEVVKVELATYAGQTGRQRVKPFVLVIARDTTHAMSLLELIESEKFFEGRYAGKALQVDSSQTGAKEDAMIERLLGVEKADNPVEIVIHVNMLKEGWDVTNLYTIIPLRAANAQVLIEQSIGRGLRLPYGKRTGVEAVDTLNIVAHDKFQEIVDEARKPGSALNLKTRELDGEEQKNRTVSVPSSPRLSRLLGISPEGGSAPPFSVLGNPELPAWDSADRLTAQAAARVMARMGNQPERAPGSKALLGTELQAQIVKEVSASYAGTQPSLPGVGPKVDIAAIVRCTAQLVVDQTIDIPRILVAPTGEVKSGFHPFRLNLDVFTPTAPSEQLWVQTLRSGSIKTIATGSGGIEDRTEDYLVACLIDFDDVAYDDHADLLYDLASQAVRHYEAHLSKEDASRAIRVDQRRIARHIHQQMQKHHWEEAATYETIVSSGFTPLKPSALTGTAEDTIRDFRDAPEHKSRIGSYVYGGFSRCLYDVQKFDSDPERQLAVVLDREGESDKWFKPAKGQFQLFYAHEGEHREYQPDFVAETEEAIYMIEPKATNQMQAPEVLLKRDAAVLWCQRATEYTSNTAGKPWKYLLVPHDAIAENVTLKGLAERHRVEPN